MSVIFALNSDNSLIGALNENGTLSIKSLHRNQKNAERLESNIKDIISVHGNANESVVSLNNMPYVVINRQTNSSQNLNELTSFETRIFAREHSPSMVPFARFSPENAPQKLRTDLHTHFAAALPPETLIYSAYGKNVVYPTWLVKKLNLQVENLTFDEQSGGYHLEDLVTDTDNYIKLINAMKIDTSEQETFNKMEEIYTARGPITKNPNTFIPMLEEIARDAKQNGIAYLELSLSSILSNMTELKKVEENLPRIEQETGVKIRFLGALYRHSDLEWNEDEVEKLKISARSPYIVGCDFMGHETNPTKDFEQQIKDLAEYAILNDPSFVIRIHAGENVLFKNNVRDCLIAVEKVHRELEEKTGKTLPYPQVRIGHGVYGFDQEANWDEEEWSKSISTMELCEKIKPIIEFNMSSNLSLNNINSIDEIPIKKYIDKGIRVVLGTDGRGIYSTTIAQEMILAKQAGLTLEDFGKIYNTEIEVMQKQEKRFKDKSARLESYSNRIHAEQQKLIPHYTRAVEEKYRLELINCQNRLQNMIKNCGAETNKEEILRITQSKKPILITGSSHSHFPKILAHPEQVKNIAVVLDVLVETLDPEKAYLMTGGTNHGVEKMLHEIAYAHNQQTKNKIVVLGTLTEEAAKDSNSPDPKKRNSNKIESHTITHAITPILNGKIAKRWFDLPDTVLDIVQESHGTMIAIGGGSIVGDMITRAHNMGLSLNIMQGVEGASNDKSNCYHGNNYSFEDAKELIYKLIKENSSLMKKDLTPKKIDKLINEANIREENRLNNQNTFQ